MLDAPAIVRAASPLLERRVPFLVATVVRVQGSSYRRPGARLLATAEGRVAGNVSGGCLESDLIRTGLWRTRNGPVVLRYDSRDPEEGDAVLGCGGIVDVLLEQGNGRDRDHPLALLAGALASGQRARMATVFRSTDPDIPLGARWCVRDEELAPPAAKGARATRSDLVERIFSGQWRPSARSASPGYTASSERPASSEPPRATSRSIETGRGAIEVLIEPIVPPPHLFVLGAGLDAFPLVRMAQQIGWSVTVWSASPSFASRARFEAAGATLLGDLDLVRARIDAADRALAIVMGHNVGRDRAALAMALGSRASYIGILGPRHRTVSLAGDFPAKLEDPRVHAPVGLDLGAETPDEVAMSIVAEMLAHLRGASREPLRRRSAIHRASG
ncbi:XdhC family protein [Pendulispora albinea]|uniref:XdhC family protein n=1 Tax=Pendulispora albinea TaxID=2741071 RepID=A0ABZ2LMI7_9BACT